MRAQLATYVATDAKWRKDKSGAYDPSILAMAAYMGQESDTFRRRGDGYFRFSIVHFLAGVALWVVSLWRREKASRLLPPMLIVAWSMICCVAV